MTPRTSGSAAASVASTSASTGGTSSGVDGMAGIYPTWKGRAGSQLRATIKCVLPPVTRSVLGACTAVLLLAAPACSMGGSTAAGPEPESSPPSSALEPPPAVKGMPEWEPLSTLQTPRDDFATAVVGDEIWNFGGMTGDRGNRLDSIEVYDTSTDRWRLYDGVMPEGIASFEGAAVGDQVFLFGGLDKDTNASDFSATLDTSTGTWRQLPSLPHPRYAHTVTLHDGFIYVIGGEAVSGPVRAVDIFDPRTETWTSGAPMPKARGSHDAASAGDVIYVLGGWLDGGPTDLVQVYDPAADAWTTTEPLPEPVSRAGAAVLDGKLWVSYHQFSAALDLSSGTWAPANPLTVSRHGLGYVATGGKIYGIGGCTETPLRDVRSVDVLDPV